MARKTILASVAFAICALPTVSFAQYYDNSAYEKCKRSDTGNQILGGVVGGSLGAIIGKEVGGKTGTIIGGAAGGTAGVAIANKDCEKYRNPPHTNPYGHTQGHQAGQQYVTYDQYGRRIVTSHPQQPVYRQQQPVYRQPQQPTYRQPQPVYRQPTVQPRQIQAQSEYPGYRKVYNPQTGTYYYELIQRR